MKTSKAAWLVRLVRRFSIVESEVMPSVSILETIQPVTSVDDLVKISRNIEASKDLSGGSAVTYFTVAVGKRWRLVRLWKPPTNAATRVTIRVWQGGSSKASSVLGSTELAENYDRMVVEEGGTIGLQGTGHVSDVAVPLILFYEEEDAF